MPLRAGTRGPFLKHRFADFSISWVIDERPIHSRRCGPGRPRKRSTIAQLGNSITREWSTRVGEKNASDAYLRDGSPENDRVIVLLFHQKGQNRLGSIACLDFVGMTRDRIENNFRRWADPNAYLGDHLQSAGSGQGGHGNGGKSYMIQMFEECSWFLTVRGNKGNKYGFLPNDPKPGYFPSPDESRDYSVAERETELAKVLALLGCGVADLPADARRLLRDRDGFTCMCGFGPRSDGRRLPVKQIIEALPGHHQMFRTLQLCKVYAIEDGRLVNGGQPLKLPDIAPMEEAPEPRILEIPETITDPKLEEEVSTTNNGMEKPGTLTLRTSRVSMRWTLKSRHNITYTTTAGKYLGQVEIRELSQSAFCERIYGECQLDALGIYETNTRDHPADAPLTRAVEEWIRKQIEGYAREFVRLERLKASQEVKNELQRMNQALDKWKNQFLAQTGIGDKVKPATPSQSDPLPRRAPAVLRVSSKHNYAGREITFKPRIEFFDSNGQRVASVPYVWRSSDWEVATVDEDSLTVRTHQPGKTELWAETLEPGAHDVAVRSNRLVIEVPDIERLEVAPAQVSLRAGGFATLTAVAITRNKERKEGVYVEWTEGNAKVAKVSPAGVIYGVAKGCTTAMAAEEFCYSSEIAVEVLDPAHGTQGFPQIKLSEIDEDPLQPGRIPQFAPEEGPVCQPEPQWVDANIWWINMSSPLARRYLEDARGGGAQSPQWRAYLLERYIEVLVKIKLGNAFRLGEELPYDEMERRWRDESVRMQERAVADLERFLDDGYLEM